MMSNPSQVHSTLPVAPSQVAVVNAAAALNQTVIHTNSIQDRNVTMFPGGNTKFAPIFVLA